MKNSKTEKLAKEGIKNLNDAAEFSFQLACDAATGSIAHQRASDAARGVLAGVRAIEVHHAAGGDVSRFLVQ